MYITLTQGVYCDGWKMRKYDSCGIVSSMYNAENFEKNNQGIYENWDNEKLIIVRLILLYFLVRTKIRLEKGICDWSYKNI